MQCVECKNSIWAYIDEELPHSEALVFERHIASCSACQKELRLRQELHNILGQAGKAAPPAGLHAALMGAVRALPPLSPKGPGSSAGGGQHGWAVATKVVAGIAVAAASSAALFTLLQNNPATPPPSMPAAVLPVSPRSSFSAAPSYNDLTPMPPVQPGGAGGPDISGNTAPSESQASPLAAANPPARENPGESRPSGSAANSDAGQPSSQPAVSVSQTPAPPAPALTPAPEDTPALSASASSGFLPIDNPDGYGGGHSPNDAAPIPKDGSLTVCVNRTHKAPDDFRTMTEYLRQSLQSCISLSPGCSLDSPGEAAPGGSWVLRGVTDEVWNAILALHPTGSEIGLHSQTRMRGNTGVVTLSFVPQHG